MPDLAFEVAGAAPGPWAAAPYLVFALRIRDVAAGAGADAPPSRIAALMLRCQIRIEPARRRYEDREKARLLNLFGEPARWGQTLRGFFWAQANLVVPAFHGETTADLTVPCALDFNAPACQYFSALEGGEVPLRLLFSGTIFQENEEGALQASPISWDKEAVCSMPVSAWKALRDQFCPQTVWFGLKDKVFEELHEFRMRRGSPSWEHAIEDLLARAREAVAS